jgi:hypothetical protein
MYNFIMTLAGIILLAGCATNPIKDSWMDPKETGPVNFEKTLVVVIMPTPADRRVAEDELVRQLPMIKGESSYDIISDKMLKKLEEAKEPVTAAGFRHVMLMRLVDSKQEIVYRPNISSAYWNRGFWSYYGGFYAVDRGGYETFERVLFELSLYELGDENLVWTGNGQLIDPREVAKSVQRLANGIIKRWYEQGIVAAPKQ